MRKKAKYLEDTPAEALTQDTAPRGRPTVANPSFPQALPELAGHRNLIAGQQASSYPMLQGETGQLSLPQTPIDVSNQPYSMPPQSMAQDAVPLGHPHFAMSDYGNSVQQGTPFTSGSMENLFPDSFDIGSLDQFNFDNRYGLAEFGMIHQMSTGMANSPSGDSSGTFNPSSKNYAPGSMSSAYEQSPSTDDQHYSYQSSQMSSRWPNEPSDTAARPPSSRYGHGGQSQDSSDGLVKHEAPPAFAIGNSAVPSPSSISSPQGMVAAYDENPAGKTLYTNLNPSSNQGQAPPDPLPPQSHPQQGRSAGSASLTSTPIVKEGAPTPARASLRSRKPSIVYEDVKQPYSYTAAFHKLAALIQRRFSPHRTAHIAKALAAIRPSFISCTMKLNKDDLVFMEKCLQRTLLEYEDFISATGTPTIIIRRTGEVVAVGKEFTILTGWSSNVLLGREPNLNTNQGGGDSSVASAAPGGSTGASTRGGTNTPRNPGDSNKPDTPVNIVDLLDDESVCDFFTDYAHLAFGDSRGSVTTPCKLLVYKTALDTSFDEPLDSQVGSRLKRSRDATADLKKGQSASMGEAGTRRRGEVDGKVDCMLCWSVKRDVFDIPMLCVMNVSLFLYTLILYDLWKKVS